MTHEDVLRRVYLLRMRHWLDLTDKARYMLVLVTRGLERELGIQSSGS